MAKFKNAAVMLTAAETARQWARNNPDKARTYIDKATGFVDERTKGRYHKQLTGLSQTAKKRLTGQQTVKGSTVRDDATSQTQPGSTRPFPDVRA